MRILIDMNLSPAWREALVHAGFDATHWSSIGPPDATDTSVMSWARENACVVLTHDLDFAAILASSGSHGPSVVQLRTSDVSVAACAEAVITTLRAYAESLSRGAIVSIDARAARVRMLPLR